MRVATRAIIIVPISSLSICAIHNGLTRPRKFRQKTLSHTWLFGDHLMFLPYPFNHEPDSQTLHLCRADASYAFRAPYGLHPKIIGNVSGLRELVSVPDVMTKTPSGICQRGVLYDRMYYVGKLTALSSDGSPGISHKTN